MNIAVKSFKIMIFLLSFAAVSAPVYAGMSEGDDPWTRPQIGIWFGPVAPLGDSGNKVSTYLGGGTYFRIPVFEYGTIAADIGYQRYPSDSLNELSVVPMYGNFIFRLPINSPIVFQLKAGAGTAWVQIQPEGRSQYDPLFMTGLEISFPAGTWVNIGMRVDYLFLYESYHAHTKRDGHLLNVGLTLYFNLDIF